jgi:hypothetical protein
MHTFNVSDPDMTYLQRLVSEAAHPCVLESNTDSDFLTPESGVSLKWSRSTFSLQPLGVASQDCEFKDCYEKEHGLSDCVRNFKCCFLRLHHNRYSTRELIVQRFYSERFRQTSFRF